MKNRLQGILSLLFATVIWGSAFIAQSVGMEHIGPFTFQMIRCALAVLFLLPISFVFDNGNLKEFTAKWQDPHLWKAGILCGLALFLAASLQQVGLVYTDAGKAGFITAMYIVLVPLLGLLFKQKPPRSTFLSVALAVAGLYLLSCLGVSEINKGDLYMIGCALAYAVQITCIDRLAQGLDGVRLNCIQALVVTVLSAPFMFLTESVEIHNILNCWIPLCYAGVLSMGVAYTLQILGQQKLEPTPAALIMSLESVIAALCGWLILQETMTTIELLGCVLVFAAVVISQLPDKIRK